MVDGGDIIEATGCRKQVSLGLREGKESGCKVSAGYALRALTIPAVAMPADAVVWVEKGRTETEPIPMISGLTQPVATGVGIGGQQGYRRERRRRDRESGKPTHVSSP